MQNDAVALDGTATLKPPIPRRVRIARLVIVAGDVH